jgi:hypothetical protein
MDRIMVAAAIGMGLVFAAGVMVGIVLMVATAIRREEKRGTLTKEPPDAAASAVRRLSGVGVRTTRLRDVEDVRR